MAQVWILRSLHAEGYERLAFDRGLVAVGWDAVGDLTSRVDQPQIHEAVRAGYPFVERESAIAYADQLFKFRSVMTRGDTVLLLRRTSPEVAIGSITSEYKYRSDLLDNVHHVRSVQWTRIDVPRVVVERELASSPPLMMVFLVDRADIVDRLQTLLQGDSLTVTNGVSGQRNISEETKPFANLQRNLNYARSLATAGQHLAQLKVGAFEVPDVFRAAWVQGVAALDYWVRQEVRTRMLQLARHPGGTKPKGFSTFEIPLGQIERVLQSHVSLVDVLDEHLAQTRGHLAYQHPDKIRDAFLLVSDSKDLWNKVAMVLSGRVGEGATVTGTDVRGQLVEIVRRRNKIAHESDEDPDNPPTKRPIDAASVTQAIDWIEQVAAAILAVLDSK